MLLLSIYHCSLVIVQAGLVSKACRSYWQTLTKEHELDDILVAHRLQCICALHTSFQSFTHGIGTASRHVAAACNACRSFLARAALCPPLACLFTLSCLRVLTRLPAALLRACSSCRCTAGGPLPCHHGRHPNHTTHSHIVWLPLACSCLLLLLLLPCRRTPSMPSWRVHSRAASCSCAQGCGQPSGRQCLEARCW
jgi:hypothetical protein